MTSKKGGRVLAVPLNKTLESAFSGFFCLSGSLVLDRIEC